jgi:hypothetical protein
MIIKKLTDLNNDFIDSLTLFNSKEIVNRIIDSIYQFTVNKSKKQLINEAKINTVINKLMTLTLMNRLQMIFHVY